MEESVRRYNNLVAQLKRSERMIAYCRSKTECEALVVELDCGHFHVGNLNNPEADKK